MWHNVLQCISNKAASWAPSILMFTTLLSNLLQGISNKSASCKTCGQKQADCAGHFAYCQPATYPLICNTVTLTVAQPCSWNFLRDIGNKAASGAPSILMLNSLLSNLLQDICKTCGQKLADCAGHLDYCRPVFLLSRNTMTLNMARPYC